MVTTAVKTKQYTHLEPGKDVFFGIAGRYIPYGVNLIEYKGREVIYEIGQVRMEASCCALDDWVSTVVPGYVIGWKSSTNDEGMPVTEVEPITDPKARQEISEIIQKREDLFVIEFWGD
ncbi:hypothetical protein ACFLYN_01805 [Chloroflexota bacterium]